MKTLKTHVVISLDTRRSKADGSYPLILRLSHQRKTISIALGYSVMEKDFDPKRRLVRSSYKGVDTYQRINNYILKKQQEANTLIMELGEDVMAGYSIKQLKELLVTPSSEVTFYTFTEQLIQELRETNRHGNARNYYNVLLAVKAFHHFVDFPFSHLNYDFVKQFETYHLSKGNSYNGLSVYLRGIRAIYNKAVQAGHADKTTSPFLTYRIKSEPTAKRALSIEALRTIVQLSLAPDHPCFHTRNYFLASYFMYGISFVDMAFLKVSNITDGRIRFKRRKTGKPYDLKVTGQLDEILSYYTKGKRDDDFIFPIIHRETLADQCNDVINQRRLYNRSLKELADLCNLQEKLTSYVSRHTFATQAMMQDVPLQAISAMLGHSRLSTTETYLKGLPNNVLDEYNAKLSIVA